MMAELFLIAILVGLILACVAGAREMCKPPMLSEDKKKEEEWMVSR